MITDLKRSLLLSVLTFGLCALVYPAIVWGFGRLAFPHAADGSLVSDESGRTIGSMLIAQKFQAPHYFHPRPSAAGASSYAADASSGSNLGPNNPSLRERIITDLARELSTQTGGEQIAALLARKDELETALSQNTEPNEKHKELETRRGEVDSNLKQQVMNWSQSHPSLVPTELVTTSGSGLDPHISPEAARFQLERVASARRLPREQVEALVEAATDRSGVILGNPPVVNVLRLNLSLDATASPRSTKTR